MHIPVELKERLKANAKATGRFLNAEVAHRLEKHQCD
ncbi:Arc family DNA-binding protein [Aristophania vespae]